MEIPFLEVRGTAHEIGLAMGRAFKDRLRAFIAFKQEGLKDDTTGAPGALAEASSSFSTFCEKLAPHLIDEMRGLAEGAEVSFEHVLQLNCGDEARAKAKHAALLEGCTGFALQPSATGGPVLAGQSKDGPGRQWDHYVVVLMRPNDRPAVLQLLYPGMLALLGVSETGMCICTNQIHDGVEADGLPVMLFKRLAWERQHVHEVEALLAEHRSASTGNFLFCDRQGDAMCLELRGHDYARVDIADGVLVHTNHYLNERLQGREDEGHIAAHRSKQRLERLSELFAQRRGQITVDYLYECYRDHDGHPHSICAHETDEEFRGTTAVFVAEPQAGRLHVSAGRTCENEPVTYGF